MVKVILIIAETSIETVPEEIAKHASVINDSKRKGVKPTELLLDRSIHHKAMLSLENNEKRGRPDILYHILLDVTSSPIFRSGYLKLYVHTINDQVIEISDSLRPPRSYDRFEGLMIQLFREGEVGGGLIKMKAMRFSDLIDLLNPDIKIGFSRIGVFKSVESIVREIINYQRPTFIIGGFPKGHFNAEVTKCLDRLYSISKFPLDSSTAVNRLLCSLESNEFFFSAMYADL